MTSACKTDWLPRCEREKAGLDAHLTACKANMNDALASVAECKQTAKNADDQHEKKVTKLESECKQAAKLQETINSLNQTLKYTKSDLESKKQETSRLTQEKNKAQNQIDTLKTENTQLKADLVLETRKASQDKGTCQERASALEESNNQCKENIASLQSSMSSITSSVKVLSDMNFRLSKDLESCNKNEKSACDRTNIQYKVQLSQLLGHFGFDADDCGGVDSAFSAALSNDHSTCLKPLDRAVKFIFLGYNYKIAAKYHEAAWTELSKVPDSEERQLNDGGDSDIMVLLSATAIKALKDYLKIIDVPVPFDTNTAHTTTTFSGKHFVGTDEPFTTCPDDLLRANLVKKCLVERKDPTSDDSLLLNFADQAKTFAIDAMNKILAADAQLQPSATLDEVRAAAKNSVCINYDELNPRDIGHLVICGENLPEKYENLILLTDVTQTSLKF